ncbi:hypothetical protein KBZ10_00925 [Streptomyces sp. F63]|uniref:hypothetical protein n=1 Tax=Streptomyces sp. F63 TaxID=2824887 RepID=UPI001B392294|nr:hypothetical protein [Streptomyces sp. F63]MBQ0983124.1 hypothetical protein [Streptomyces sp. F63]
MGRHSRQNHAGYVRSTALRAAAALGVAGTIAVALGASSDDDRTARARADVRAQDRGPDLPASPAVSPGERGTPTSSGTLSPSSSAAPRPAPGGPEDGSLRSGAAAAASTPGARATDGRPGRAGAHGTAAREAQRPERQPGGGSAPDGARPAPGSAGTDAVAEPGGGTPADGTGGESRDGEGTSLGGVVHGVTGVVGGLTGDLTGDLTGGLGWGGSGLLTG